MKTDLDKVKSLAKDLRKGYPAALERNSAAM